MSSAPATSLTPRGSVYVVMAVVAPFVALGLGDPAPVLVALPAAAVVVFGFLSEKPAIDTIDVEIAADHVSAGGALGMTVVVRGRGRRVLVDLDLPVGLEISEIEGGRRIGPASISVPLIAGKATAHLTILARRWGGYHLGGATIRVSGSAPIRLATMTVAPRHRLVVLPSVERSRRLLEPLVTTLHAGDFASRRPGPGFEMAESRQWAPGDSPRLVNWRASSRSDQQWVTERQAERNGDLVFVLDAVPPAGESSGGAVRDVVGLVAALVSAHGAARHRLGLIDLGGRIRWFGLASGPVHTQRLLAAVISTQVNAEPLWSAFDRVIDRAVRPPSMVVVVSSLTTDEMVGRVRRLADAGIDVVAVAVDPGRRLTPSDDPLRRVARRIWALERERTLDLLRVSRVAVAEWVPGRHLEAIVEEVELWRRRMRRLRV